MRILYVTLKKMSMLKKGEDMVDKIKLQGINAAGFGIIPKLVMQDRELHATAKAIYAYFCSFAGAGETCFPTRSKICYDLCISIETFYKYLKNLIRCGYVKVDQIKENGRFSHNVYTLCSTKLPCTEIPDTEDSVYGNIDTKNNSLKNNSILKNNNTDVSKKERKTKKLSPTSSKPDKPSISFDTLIENYTENVQLREELKEHLKVRKQKKGALTNRAIQLSLSKLDKIGADDYEKIKIVQNAIMNGWTGFFPLKPDEKKTMKKANYDIEAYERSNRELFEAYPSGDNERRSAFDQFINPKFNNPIIDSEEEDE